MKFFRWWVSVAREAKDAPAARTLRRRITVTVERQWASMQLRAQAPENAEAPVQATAGMEAPHIQLPPPSAAGKDETKKCP
ncbi:MAG: hypothetical protein ACLQGV_04830 [Bryobacteraceae bacterium]